MIAEPATLTQLGQMLDKSPGWVRRHLKTLERAGLVEMIGLHAVGRIREKYYQATQSTLVWSELILQDGQKTASLDHATEFRMKPIGIIHTPFKEMSGMPIQASRSTAFGEIEAFPKYEARLESIDGLSHLILIYVFHAALNSTDLMVKPFLDDTTHGIFATRFYS